MSKFFHYRKIGGVSRINQKLRKLRAMAAVAWVLAFCIPLMGQVVKGSISGTVTDPQNAVVPNAQVKANNIDTGAVFNTVTDNSGVFRLSLLPIGVYNIEIAAPGFKTAENKGVVVSAAGDSGLGNIHMTVGEASTTIEISAEAPLLETSQAQVSSTFSGTTLSTFAGIQENEGLDRLALFVPGVASSRSNNFSNTNGVGFSSNGLRGRNNDQELDGQNNNDNSVGGPALIQSDPNFLQQYVIVTNNFGPEYGRNGGSVVNLITQSGTNSWHGSLYGTENNSYLNALSNSQRFNGLSGPPRSNNEFTGGTIGGPVLKNKAFLFSGFDDNLFSGSNLFNTDRKST